MSTPCLDLIREAVGWLTDDGTLQPRNEAMRRFCCDFGGSPDGLSLRHLPLAIEDREVIDEFLAAADAAELALESSLTAADGERCLHLRLQRVVEGCWLVIDDCTELSRWRHQAMRLERVRLVGAMGQGLIHDLNNVMSTLMGLADHMAELQTEPDSKAFLRSVVDGTKDRSGLLKGLYRIMSGGSTGLAAVPLQSLFDDVSSMFQKTAMHAEVRFTATAIGELPTVRVIAEDVLHALLVVLMQGVESAAGPIHLEAEPIERDAALPGLPKRIFGRLRIIDGGDPALLSQLENGLATPAGGFRIADHALGLFQVVVALGLRGALVEIAARPDGRRQVDLLLPIARERGAATP